MAKFIKGDVGKEKGDGSIFHLEEDFSMFFSLFKINRSKA